MTWRGDLPVACWTASDALAIIPVEAESTSDGVFLATHTSIPIVQRDQVDSAIGGTIVDEHDLLRAVQELPADQPIIPVLGKSGTGKSHLVRWLRANLETEDSTRLIFVPKHRMSLRGILELVLQHATSERAEELRAKVATAVDAASDEAEARLRLRGALAVLVETRGARKDGTAEENELRDYLASPTGLPALLGDPVFRGRLLADNSPIARLVREKLSGKGTEDKEDAFGFSAADLNLSVDDVSKAGADAASVAGALTSDASLRDLAAKMLNEQLGPAVSEVFGIGGDDLKQLLVELRLDLRQQNLELLLLIEDFSIFQGIQGGLIDAITLIPTAEVDLCPMRVVMAVTTGYFVNQMPETVYTRTYKVFDLELPAGEDVAFNPAEFAARYLNAVRVGSSAIDELHKAGDSVPNHCLQCPVQEKCHQAFGQVNDIGLFPFNMTALNLAMRSQSRDGGFIARDVLTRVLRPVLHRDQFELNEGRFPSAGFENDFRAGALDILDNIEDQVRLRTPGDPDLSERRVRMVRFWGPGKGPQNLDPTIHDAFDIPPLEKLTTVPVVPPRPPGGRADHDERDSKAATPPPPPPPAQDPPLVRAVDRWRATGDLNQTDRNHLRNIVHAAVTACLGFEDGYGGDGYWTSGKRELAPSFDAKDSIALDDNRLQQALIPIDRSNDEDVRVLRALAWVNEEGSWVSVPNGEALQRLCVERIQSWAAHVSASLLPEDQRDNPELARLTQALLAVSKALGIADAYKPDALSQVKAIFASQTKLADPTVRPQLRRWQDRFIGTELKPERELLQQRLLRLASYSQGTGGKPLALDLPRLLRAVRDNASDATCPEQTLGFIAPIVDGIQSRIAVLDPLLSEALELIPDVSDLGGEVAEVAKALNTFVTERSHVGELPASIDGNALASAARAIKSSDLKRVQDVGQALRTWDTLTTDERLRRLTSGWEGSAARVRNWHNQALAAVAALEQKLTAGPTSEAQREHDEALKRLVAGLETASREIASVTGPEGVA
ncbi:protein DpdH [Nonomuraea angiospora]|uniref:protein DpdH n=1 Tax=Nonomuraea angiospora TaxID=46172 RepID=UPI0029B7386D|nr:protein DpdH [Nonomuraea angiospora]MDX3106011.1 protein DpdH [Nonomuraea angiospora]